MRTCSRSRRGRWRTGVKYGHIIKHLEPEHLGALPVPKVNEGMAADFRERYAKVLATRNESHQLTMEAERRFEAAVGGTPRVTDTGEQGFAVGATAALAGGRRRFEACFHSPAIASLRRHLQARGRKFVSIAASGYEVWLPTRFRRVLAEDGVWMLGSADLTEVNPDLTKRIAEVDFGDRFRGRVEAGWILMARSGQTYGVIGSAMLAGKALEGLVISDHVMRIRPGKDVDMAPGYLVTALSHPTLGRPLVKALAYGSSIPEIEVADVSALEIVRLSSAEEASISRLAEKAAEARANADVIERGLARDAGEAIDRFIAQGDAVRPPVSR